MRSVSPEELKHHLEIWPVAKNKFESKIVGNTIHLTIIDNLDERNIKNLLTWINNLGWFVDLFLIIKTKSTWEKFNEKEFIKKYMNDTKGVVFDIKAKYDKENTHIQVTPDFYHVTPSKYESKILKIGLIPKSKGKIGNHPDRIYLVKRIVDAVALAETFSIMENEHDYTIFKVNIEEAKKRNDELKLYYDPSLNSGLYTLTNIHPNFLIVIKRIQV